MADLKTLSTTTLSDKGVQCFLKNPGDDAPILNDDGTPMSITLLGQDSKAYQTLKHSMSNEKIEKAVKFGKKLKLNSEKLENDELDLLVKSTVEWDITYQGQKPDCTPENVRLLYTQVPSIREIVSDFIVDRTNFLGN